MRKLSGLEESTFRNLDNTKASYLTAEKDEDRLFYAQTSASLWASLAHFYKEKLDTRPVKIEATVKVQDAAVPPKKNS